MNYTYTVGIRPGEEAEFEYYEIVGIFANPVCKGDVITINDTPLDVEMVIHEIDGSSTLLVSSDDKIEDSKPL